MSGRLIGAACALRPCVGCGESTWVLDSNGTCPDCGGRSTPKFSQADLAADCAQTEAAFGALLPIAVDGPDRCAQIFAALQEVKTKRARYGAFAYYRKGGLDYAGVCRAYVALEKLLRAKLDAYYG